jgi:hypothetical protein
MLAPKDVHAKQIADLEYLQTEQLGIQSEDRRVVYDLYCRTHDNDSIDVEMQQISPGNFENRLLYYSTYPIRQQAPKRNQTDKTSSDASVGSVTSASSVTGPWKYDLKQVYIIAVTNFSVFDDGKVLEWVQLRRVDSNQFVTDKLNFAFVDLTKFTKQQHELETQWDKILFFIKHAGELTQQPTQLHDKFFDNLFDLVSNKHLTTEEMEYYKSTKLTEGEIELIKAGSEYIGEKHGRYLGKQEAYTEFVTNLFEQGLTTDKIAGMTRLTVGEVMGILKNIGSYGKL